MNFELTDDQRMLVQAVTAFTRKQSPVTRMRELRRDPIGWSPEVWRQMGELGWLGLAFPEAVGGIGGTFVDVALVLEQLGTTLVPEPLVSSLVAGTAILVAGTAQQQQEWLAPMIEGRTTLALAYAETDGRGDVRATTATRIRDEGYEIRGTKRFVLDAAASAFVVTCMVDGELALVVVDRTRPGVSVRSVPTIDGRRAAIVDFDVAVPLQARLSGDAHAALARALDVGAAAACAEGVGIMRTVLAMTVDYLKTREQFGVKIGTFQALQHRAVDMFVETELAYSSALAAAIRIDGDDLRERTLAVSAAKIQLAESGRYVTQQAIQLHGGIGITDEHDVGLYFKRMHALTVMFGDAEDHLSRFADQ
jgi:alkylation response protein AidB-like acyl-CoA dehydrogenase